MRLLGKELIMVIPLPLHREKKWLSNQTRQKEEKIPNTKKT